MRSNAFQLKRDNKKYMIQDTHYIGGGETKENITPHYSAPLAPWEAAAAASPKPAPRRFPALAWNEDGTKEETARIEREARRAITQHPGIDFDTACHHLRKMRGEWRMTLHPRQQ
jgi:hypothetical protein